jgi:hypothetical protein
MTKTHIIFLVLVATIVSNKSYGQENQKQDFKILVLKETPIFIDIDSLKGASLNGNEMSILVNLTDKCIQKWNGKLTIMYADGHKDDRKPEDYYKQYLPAYSKSGDKLVWVNFIRKRDVK